MDDVPRSDWEHRYAESIRREHTDSIRREREEQAKEPWWSSNRLRGSLFLAAIPALAMDLTLEAFGVEENWPALVVYIAALAASAALAVRRHTRSNG